jgi:putative transposase
MARIARVVAPGLPHHVTQRGNRRLQTFFGDDDDNHAYPELMSEWCAKCKVQIWAYCLMPNHKHGAGAAPMRMPNAKMTFLSEPSHCWQ